MFVCSIVFYLSVKKLQTLNVDKRIITFANYILPSLVFLVVIIVRGETIFYSFWLILLIIVLRVVFNYLGTISGYKSMEDAPNAGYSLVIQKSYAIYTLFAAAVLYGSEVSLHRFFLSIFILICASLVAFSKSKNKVRSYKWVSYAVVAMLSFGSISLSSKFFISQGMTTSPILFWVCLFTLLFTVVDSRRVQLKMVKMTKEIFTFMIILGISVSGFYYFKLTAEVAAPNLGYVSAINAASNAVYTVLVAKIFGDHLSKTKLLAVVGMTVGLILLLFT